MASFTQVNATDASFHKACALLPQLQTIWKQSQFALAAIQLYNAGTDTTFNNTINAIFTAAERNQLSQMLSNLVSLNNAWTANHSDLLNTPIE